MIRAANGQSKTSASCICEIALVRAHSLPSFLIAKLHQHARSLLPTLNEIKVGLQVGSVLSKKCHPVFERFSYRRQPLPRSVGSRQPRGRLWMSMSISRIGRGTLKRLANAGEDLLLLTHLIFLPFQYSLKVCRAIGGRSRVLVQPYAGSTRVPRTSGWSFCNTRPAVLTR